MCKHEFLNLNLGLVKENFAIVKKENRKIWEDRGFSEITEYPIFHYKPNSSEIVMLGVPLNIEQFGADKFNDSQILDVCTCCGTYGMGGPGFFGLKLQGNYGTRWLTYCIWAAGEHILFDDRILECHPNYSEQYKPLISFENHSRSLNVLKELLTNMTVKEFIVTNDSFEIRLVDSEYEPHIIQSYKFSAKFPEQGGTGKKRNSFETGEMKDYLLVTFDDTYLMV
ncbi:MAG: hypothetical protein IKC39_01535 [Clostridia bacterium]|nr:hypothetical protein [Clostridia bacterium]